MSSAVSVMKLGQHLNEKCSFVEDVRLELCPVHVFQDMGCFPGEQEQKKSELSYFVNKSSTEKLYGEDISMAFNDFPPDMVKDKLANCKRGANYDLSATPIHIGKYSSSPDCAALPPQPPNPIKKQPHHLHQRKYAADILPMSRRVTLSRFLESRKNRMMARTPYN